MLARRHLRIRVLQTLYAFYQNEKTNIANAQKDLFNGTDRIYDLYLTLIQLLIELAHHEKLYMSDVSGKFLVSKKKYFRTLSKHPLIDWLCSDENVNKQLKDHKISLQDDTETIKKVFYKIRTSAVYKEYTLEQEDINDADWIVKLYKEDIQHSELLNSVLEEKNIWWAESIELAHTIVLKTIKNFFLGQKNLLPLYKDEEDDKAFMQKLLKETIANNDELTKLISGRTTNWEVDRIALMDILILKMALTEVMKFDHIPVKVSLNEYIDISKDYSTPQSKAFINGIIDKIVGDLKADNRLTKTGRGLIE